jgi:ATP-binding cassette, subfamily B, bacterial HlyB/CyaB
MRTNTNSPLDREADAAALERGSEPSYLACLVLIARQHGLHLTVSQLVHDNVLIGQEVSIPELLKCGSSAGL